MRSPPEVSVIISVYNDEKFLEESLQSILMQSFENYEVIIINDASNDGSQKIIDQFLKKDSRFKAYINKENSGLGASLNRAIQISVGRYIARHDGDDVCDPLRFERQVRYLNAHPHVTLLGGAAHEIDGSGHKKNLRQYPESHDDIRHVLWSCPIIHPTVMMHSSALKDIGGYPALRRRQDYALWFRAAKAGWVFHNLPDILTFYRVEENSWKKTPPKDAWLQFRIGCHGYFKLGGLNPKVYVAMLYPFIRSCLPYSLQRGLANMLVKFDPRKT